MPAARHRLNFTKPALDALPAAPHGRRTFYNDWKVRGLQLIVTERGVKSFYLYTRNRGKPLRYFLGHYPDLTPELARRKAEAARGRVAMNEDLRAEKQRRKAHGATLADAFEAFKLARVNLKRKTLYDYARFLNVAFGDWKDRPIVELTKDKVAARHRKIGEKSGPAHADNAMRFLRSLINFAQFHYEDPDGRPLLPDNPVRRLSQTRAWFRVKRRTTYVRPDGLAPWFKAVLQLKTNTEDREAVAVADWLLLMMLTGLRRSEALTLRWADVDLKNDTITLRDTKNGEDHSLPLSDFLHELFEARRQEATSESEFVFASYGDEGHLVDPRKPLQRVIDASGVSFTPHDLRRTFITVAESLDIPAYALKRLLNHKMRQDVTAGYIVADVERLRRPMQLVTDFMLKRASLRPSARVTPLHEEAAHE
jgi:integrase